MARISLLLSLVILPVFAFSQTATHRFDFKFILNKKTERELNRNKYYITDPSGKKFMICDNSFYFSVTQKENVLLIDSHKILGDTLTDSCLDSDTLINANTVNNLQIVIGKREHIGNNTGILWLHYRTWVVGVNSVGVKLRPRVRDYRDSLFYQNALTGSINIGFSIGRSYGWTKFTAVPGAGSSWSVTPSFSLGLSSAKLSDGPLRKAYYVKRNSNNLVLGPAISIIGARNDIGIIISYGRDLMVGKNSKAWGYQAKGFVGIGLTAGLKL